MRSIPSATVKGSPRNRTYIFHVLIQSGDRGGGAWIPDPAEKSPIAIGFLRNSGMDPTREAIGPIASQGRSV